MTAKRENDRTANRVPRPSAETVTFWLMSTVIFFLILLYSEAAISSMKNALALCAKTVIPSLFPFMVASELIIKSGAASSFGRLLAPALRRAFGVGGAGASAILLGVLCGFPIGARSAASLYKSGQIDRRELTKILCICNQPSSAFVVSAVGISLFGSRAFGMLLLATTLLSATVIGIALRFLIPNHSEPPNDFQEQNAPPLFVLSLSDAVVDAARSMLAVCAFVCFFSTLVGTLSSLPIFQSAPAPLVALTFGFFEMTGGTQCAALCSPSLGARLLCAGIVGWSGLSVHFQVMCLCQNTPVSYRPYFAAKAMQGALNVMLLFVALRLFPALLADRNDIPSASLVSASRIWPIWLFAFLVACLILALRKPPKENKIRQKKTAQKEQVGEE